MLRPCNTREWVHKSGVIRLTMHSVLFSLWSRVAVPLAAVLVAASLAGCASMAGKDMAPEAKQALVTERINARWDLLIKGDLDEAYKFLSAGSQEAMSLKVYKAKVKPGMWRAVKVDSMDCEAEICQVKMTLTYDHRLMKGVQTPFQETWILEKGNAWYVYRDRE